MERKKQKIKAEHKTKTATLKIGLNQIGIYRNVNQQSRLHPVPILLYAYLPEHFKIGTGSCAKVKGKYLGQIIN